MIYIKIKGDNAMKKVLDVSDANFDNEVKRSTIPVLVDFYATWCGPCRQLSPIIEDLAIEYENKIRIIKVNIDESPIKTNEYNIQTVPSLMLFTNGELKESFIQARQKSELKNILDKYVS